MASDANAEAIDLADANAGRRDFVGFRGGQHRAVAGEAEQTVRF